MTARPTGEVNFALEKAASPTMILADRRFLETPGMQANTPDSSKTEWQLGIRVTTPTEMAKRAGASTYRS
jgi:hypothetical protein